MTRLRRNTIVIIRNKLPVAARSVNMQHTKSFQSELINGPPLGALVTTGYNGSVVHEGVAWVETLWKEVVCVHCAGSPEPAFVFGSGRVGAGLGGIFVKPASHHRHTLGSRRHMH